jgi:protein AbiQ
MKYTFLTEKFYKDYSHDKYPQMAVKESRPYAHIRVEAYDQLFCIPLRSHIEHPHAFFTNKRNRCGIDYSKAVIINNDTYIDENTRVFLRPDEYNKLKGKDFRIKKEFLDYIELYKRAKIDKTVDHREDILAFSTLQYFEEYIYSDTNKDTN